MAHGGHCGGHFHHHHHRRGRGADIPLPVAIFFLVISLALVFVSSIIESDIDGKRPLEGSYTTYPNYLVDETNYLSDHEKIISGLQYLHEKTNVQAVVITASGSWSDRKVVEKYKRCLMMRLMS